MRQRHLSTPSLFIPSPLRGCMPPWELRRSNNSSLKERWRKLLTSIPQFEISECHQPSSCHVLTKKKWWWFNSVGYFFFFFCQCLWEKHFSSYWAFIGWFSLSFQCFILLLELFTTLLLSHRSAQINCHLACSLYVHLCFQFMLLKEAFYFMQLKQGTNWWLSVS